MTRGEKREYWAERGVGDLSYAAFTLFASGTCMISAKFSDIGALVWVAWLGVVITIGLLLDSGYALYKYQRVGRKR